MEDRLSDQELVASHLRGDATALAAIYDRYADRLFDTAAAMLRDHHEAADATQDVFLITAEKLGQLRNPERLKPWMFAILRNEVYRRTRQRRRTLPIDFTAPQGPDMAAPIDPMAEGEGVVEQELAELVRAAAAGLDPRDQLVLELSVRQGLTGDDLSQALGVTAEQCHVLVHRMRDRVERSLGALTVARMGQKDCHDLAQLLKGWDGTFSVLVRKRVARHIEACELCTETKRRSAVIPLIGAAPALAAPAGLRDLVLASAGAGGPARSDRYRFDDEGFPQPARSSRRIAALVAVLAAVLLVGSVGVALAILDNGPESQTASATTVEATSGLPSTSLTTGGVGSEPTTEVPAHSTTSTSVATPPPGVPDAPTTTQPKPPPATTVPTTSPTTAPTTPPTTTPPPGRLTLSSSVLDLGATGASAQLILANTGGTAVVWEITGSAAPFIWSTTLGSLLPGQSTAVQIGIDRSGIAEGSISRLLTVSGDGEGGGVIEARASVERSPVVAIIRSVPAVSCPWSIAPTVVASVTDESSITSVVLSWSGPGPSGSASMASSGPNEWTGRLGIGQVNGSWTWVVTGVDSRGNVGMASGVIVVRGC